MFKKLLTGASVVLLLTGCATARQPTEQSHYTSQNDVAQIQLAEAAVSVSHSLSQLAALDSAANPDVRLPPPPNPGALQMAQLASVDWSGPLEPIIRKIANASHYKVRIIGKTPTVPIIVDVLAQNVPLADILRNISYQAEKYARIAVYPHQRVIELRYLQYS